MGGHFTAKDIVVLSFNYTEQNGYLKISFRLLWGEMSVGGVQLLSNLFGHLKRALELLISVRMSPLPIFQDHLVDAITPGKKQQINTHP